MTRAPGLFVVSLLFVVSSTRADDRVDYLKQIKPLLKHHCVSCHGPLRRNGGLRLDAAKLMRKGGDSGTALVPGKPDESLLVGVLTGKGGYTRMPKDGKPLKPAEIALIRNWVQQGTLAPKDETIEKSPRDHWAFCLPQRPAVPKVKNEQWVRNPIDAFVAAQHEKRGLKPQPPASRRVLLRRVYLDLIGLPPTPQELQAFLNDKSPRAYEKVVDRLLNSPRYGERWGRHWMDVWRYSDWYGYRAQLRNSARHIWRWRDYIVESLNENRPYDQMIVDMLAADENSPTDRDRLRATGYLARHYYKFNRDVWLDDAVEHTGKAFLGLTINCAKCHEHKYDPIEQRDFYEFRALFEPYLVRTDRVPGQPDVNKDGLALAYDAKPKTKTFIYERGNDKHPIKDDPVSPEIPDFFAGGRFKVHSMKLPPQFWYPGMRPYLRRELIQKAEAAIHSKRGVLARAEVRLRAARKQWKEHGRTQRRPAIALKPKAARSSLDARTIKPFLIDDFKAARPAVWKPGPGKWKYHEGKLMQSEVANSRQFIRTQENHPVDFTAIFQFRTTGGALYKSVGLSFDDDGHGKSDGVYLSAYASGPKLQVVHRRGNKTTYPRTAAKRLPVKVGAKQELRIDVRGPLLNASVNGKLQLVYELPKRLEPGKLTLWTFDATAEFLRIAVKPLPPNTRLAGGTRQQASRKASPQSALQRAEAAHQLVRLELQAAEAAMKSLRARIAADDARYAETPPKNTKALIAAASRAEKLAKVRAAEVNVAKASAKDARAKPQAKKGKSKTKRVSLAAAKKQLAAARKDLENDDGQYSPITKTYPHTSTGRRLALAKWIASKHNPLTARVAVNHIWMRHFGQALVPTVFDFGLNGKPPSHPQLLDWLAVEFMNPRPAVRTRREPRGWSMKHLHRLIVTSNTYRMSSSSRGRQANVKLDQDNVFLWRFNSRRLEAEAVRDSVLFVAGRLDLTMGGPELDAKLGQTTFRRSIYYRHAPEKFMPFLKIFDGASTNECYRRAETVVPQQSLAMINSRLVLEQSRRLTALLNQSAKTDAEFVDRLFVRLLCRPPTPEERSTCRQFLKSQRQRLAKTKNFSTFVGGTKVKLPPSNNAQVRAHENLAHVMLNHNEFVTIR